MEVKIFIVAVFKFLGVIHVGALTFENNRQFSNQGVFGVANGSVTLGCKTDDRFGYCRISRNNKIVCEISAYADYSYNRNSACNNNDRVTFVGNPGQNYCAFKISAINYSGKIITVKIIV